MNIFLSHSSKDKPFARRLGNDLRNAGAFVWIDEAEIRVGDSLIEKISGGLNDANFILVVLSKNSVKSEWVKRELHIALTREIVRKKVNVLPCIVDNCKIPAFLTDKKYADFKDHNSYSENLLGLFTAIKLKIPDKKYLFLNQHIFYDLIDQNDGFDMKSTIRHFGKNDFAKVLLRCEYFGISIFGIESWINKDFSDVLVVEDYKLEPNDSKWYQKAFKDLLVSNDKALFSASYGIPQKLLKIFIS